MFTEEQTETLSGPLNSAHVKTRKNYGGGPELSYIESWVAISEANRIFGFDGWSSETVQIERVATTPYEKNNKDMIAVSYMARVRVSAGGIVREGCGYGDGQSALDKAGAAHELALKEAESDARKRALMTFGNPFGLALYDKKKENVAVMQDDAVQRKARSKSNSRNLYTALSEKLEAQNSVDAVLAWESGTKVSAAIASLPTDWRKTLDEEIATRKHSLLNKQAAA